MSNDLHNWHHSGHAQKAPLALFTLQQLLRDAKRTVAILPGSGINPDTVGSLLEALVPYGLQEFHLSAGTWVQSDMSFRRNGMGMGPGGDGDWAVWRTKEDVVRSVRQIADDHLETHHQRNIQSSSSGN